MTKEQCRACGEWFEDSELDAHLSEHMNDEPESEDIGEEAEQLSQPLLESPLPQGAKGSSSLLDPGRSYYFVNPGHRGLFIVGSWVWGNIYDENAKMIARSRKRVLLERSDTPGQHTVLDVPAGQRDVPWKVLRANRAFRRGTKAWDEVLFEELDGTPIVSLRTEREFVRGGPPHIIDGSGKLLGTTSVKSRWGRVRDRPRMSFLPPIGGDEALIADQAKRPNGLSRPTDEFEITDRLGRMISEVREHNPLRDFEESHEKTREELARTSTWEILMWSEKIDRRSPSTQFYALHVLDPSYDKRILIGFSMLYLQRLHRITGD